MNQLVLRRQPQRVIVPEDPFDRLGGRDRHAHLREACGKRPTYFTAANRQHQTVLQCGDPSDDLVIARPTHLFSGWMVREEPRLVPHRDPSVAPLPVLASHRGWVLAT